MFPQCWDGVNYDHRLLAQEISPYSQDFVITQLNISHGPIPRFKCCTWSELIACYLGSNHMKCQIIICQEWYIMTSPCVKGQHLHRLMMLALVMVRQVRGQIVMMQGSQGRTGFIVHTFCRVYCDQKWYTTTNYLRPGVCKIFLAVHWRAMMYGVCCLLNIWHCYHTM